MNELRIRHNGRSTNRDVESFLIYRSRNHLQLFRCLGLFCLGNAILWMGVTYKRDWIGKREPLSLKKIKMLIQTDTAPNSSPCGTKTNEVSLTDEKEEVISNSKKLEVPQWFASVQQSISESRKKNIEKINHFKILGNSIEEYIKNISEKISEHRDIIIPCCTSSLAVLTTAFGFWFPRRVVYQISLLPFSSTTSNLKIKGLQKNSRPKSLVEITTYGGFGLRKSGYTFQVPLNKILFPKSSSIEKAYLRFKIKGKYLNFLVETANPEFLNPYDFEYILMMNNEQ